MILNRKNWRKYIAEYMMRIERSAMDYLNIQKVKHMDILDNINIKTKLLGENIQGKTLQTYASLNSYFNYINKIYNILLFCNISYNTYFCVGKWN